MAVAVVDADGAIVQVGPQSLRYLILQTVMLHQPSAQLLVGGHTWNDLVAIQAGRFDMGGDPKHIVQTLLRLRVQRLGQMVVFRRVHPVYRLRQLVQLLERGIAVQPGLLEMPVECGDGTVSVQYRGCDIGLARRTNFINFPFEFIRRHRQFQLFKYTAAGYIQL